MKPINIFLLGIGGYLFYKWYTSQNIPVTNAVTNANPNVLSLPGVSMSIPETTGIAQIVPTPSTIMPLSVATGTPSNNTGACDCCKSISGGSINKNIYVI